MFRDFIHVSCGLRQDSISHELLHSQLRTVLDPGILEVDGVDLDGDLVGLLQVSLYVHPVSLDLSAADLTAVDVGQQFVLPHADASLLGVLHLVAVDEVDPEGEVPVVDVEAVGALVHCPVAPLWHLLCSNLPAFVLQHVVDGVLYVVQLHVGPVIGGDGQVVLHLDVVLDVAPHEE